MEIPTLVVSDPPHGEVDLKAAAEVLALDIFVTRVKAKFTAAEIMYASRPGRAAAFATALRETGFTVSLVHGAELADLPWPDPASALSIDSSVVLTTVGHETIEIGSGTEVLAVACRPPAHFSRTPPPNLSRAVASGHGPTIAEAIQWMAILDLSFHDGRSLRRVSIVPHLLELDAQGLLTRLGHQLAGLRVDARLVGVSPRARFVPEDTDPEDADPVEEDVDPDQRRRGYSFGTPLLHHALESISPEMPAMPQYELGSRLAYALSPLGAADRVSGGG
jgi:hypothetical protein